MKDKTAYIVLGEISLIFGKMFDLITIENVGQALILSVVSGIGALIPKLIYDYIKKK